MRTKTVLLVVSTLCFVLSAERLLIADSVQATAYTWGWGCSRDSQAQQGSTKATASANCVDTTGAGAESSGYALVTRDPQTALGSTITVSALSSANNGDNTWAGATGSWNESVVVSGGTGQGLLWLYYGVSGSLVWGTFSSIEQDCITGVFHSDCFFPHEQPPVNFVDIIPFTSGQPFELAARLDAEVVASYGPADVTLEVGPPSYSVTDLNWNSIPGASVHPTPEPGTLLLFGTGLLALGGTLRGWRHRRRLM
jgi:hypothetical protein